jgi:uncharacterized iron-regulated membrane protein
MLKWSIFLHKWIGLIVGVQVLGWVLGGVVMSVIPIGTVRSEHRVAQASPPILPTGGVVDWRATAEGAGISPVQATLKTTLRGTLWVIDDVEGKTHVFDAASGKAVAPLGEREARFLAGAAYEGPGKPVAIRYFQTPPQEAGRDEPLWRVAFDDPEKTSFYLSPQTGEVAARRSDVWRFYDFFWRLHILDFETGEDFNNPLLIAAALLTLPMVLTGLILLWIRIGRDLRMALARKRVD